MGTSFKQAEAQLIAASKLRGRFAKQPGGATANFKAQEKSMRQISDLTKGLKSAKITIKYERESTTGRTEEGSDSRVERVRPDTGQVLPPGNSHTVAMVRDKYYTFFPKLVALLALSVKSIEPWPEKTTNSARQTKIFTAQSAFRGLMQRLLQTPPQIFSSTAEMRRTH